MDTTRHLKKFALALAGAFMAIVAVILNLDQLYLMAATLFLLPLASNLVGRAMLRGLECRRAPVAACHEGECVTVTLALRNTGRLPKMYLRVTDSLPPGLRRVGEAAPLLPQLAPGEEANVSYLVEAQRRGAYRLGPTRVSSPDPLGFSTRTVFLPQESEMLVYPTVLPLRRLVFTGGGAWGQRETDSAPTRGGLDFHGVREYQPGDELRRVHWRTTARTGTLAVMEYTQGTASDILVVLDLNRAAYAGAEDALETAVKMTASACDYLLRQGFTVRVALPTRPGPPLSLQSSGEMPVLLETLARAQASATETLAETLTGALPWVTAGLTVLYVSPDVASAATRAALAEGAARGAHLFGFGLDRESFPSAGRGGGLRRPAPAALPGMAWVQAGDDLAMVMEGSYARG